MTHTERHVPAGARGGPAPARTPADSSAEPLAEFAPRGALAVSLGYFALLAVLWGLVYLDLLRRGG